MTHSFKGAEDATPRMSAAGAKRQAAKARRRSEIVDAAARVFSGRGVTSATMDEVALEAAVSKGTLYLYFKSKDELFLTIALEALDTLADSMESVDPAHFGSGRAWLRRLADEYVRYAGRNRDRFLTGMSWLTSGYSVSAEHPLFVEYKDAIGRIQGVATRAVARGQRDGSLPTGIGPERLALQVWSATFGTLLMEARTDELARRLPPEFSTENLALSFLDALLGPSREGAEGDTRRPTPLRGALLDLQPPETACSGFSEIEPHRSEGGAVERPASGMLRECHSLLVGETCFRKFP